MFLLLPHTNSRAKKATPMLSWCISVLVRKRAKKRQKQNIHALASQQGGIGHERMLVSNVYCFMFSSLYI